MPRSPASSRIGSPGSRRMKAKATIETPMKVGMTSASR
jgi:hypothetical protein